MLTEVETWTEFDRQYVGDCVSMAIRVNHGFVIMANAPDGTKIKSTYNPETKEVVWEYLM